MSNVLKSRRNITTSGGGVMTGHSAPIIPATVIICLGTYIWTSQGHYRCFFNFPFAWSSNNGGEAELLSRTKTQNKSGFKAEPLPLAAKLGAAFEHARTHKPQQKHRRAFTCAAAHRDAEPPGSRPRVTWPVNEIVGKGKGQWCHTLIKLL